MKVGDFLIRTERSEAMILRKHTKRNPENPSNGTFPPNGIDWQKKKWRKKKQEQFKRDVDLVVRFERRKRMRVLLADLGPGYLEGLRNQSFCVLKVA
jgi:hypothetical protein